MLIKINLLEAVAAKALQSGDIVYTEKNGKIDSMNVWKLGARRTSAARGIGDPKVDRIKIEGFAASPCYTHYLADGDLRNMWSSKRHILSDTQLKKFKRTDLKGLIKAALDGKITGVRLKVEDRAKLENKLALLKAKAKAATPAGDKAWFVVDTSTRPATPLSGPYPDKAAAESRMGVRPNRAVKRLSADTFKPKATITPKASVAKPDKKPSTWVTAPKSVVDPIKAEFKEYGFRIKNVFKKHPGGRTPYAIEGVLTTAFGYLPIVIHPNGDLHVFRNKAGARRRLDGSIAVTTIGKATNKAERKALLEKLTRMRNKQQKA
ncbi:hypothetical protein O152_gp083 [Pseudomonas phage PaBG]|uniref:Uncharacterized protein n=1 Tax=Pseudomonas phage PaBG TaxID=1335230 RepID=S5VV46_9CAUD|nr:hypothetical protein O152_gp083 [Pseudomonas phage PaBG]AGS81967.1 hypothetical protein PaBG_00083 [Pseudomonas phage PaBG]